MEINILNLLKKQLDSNFIISDSEKSVLDVIVPKTITECINSFKNINDKYYMDNELNPYNSSQYAIFLYHLSKNIYKRFGYKNLCDALFYLNKMLNCVDLYYQIELPDNLYLEHPLGTVLGRAKYGDYLSVSQGVTVGMNRMKTPEIGNYVTLFPNSSILGDCKIGNYVVLSVGTTIKDENISDNCIVFGSTPNLIIKKVSTDEIKNIICDRWIL